MKISIIIISLTLFLFSCENLNEIIPNSKVQKISSYHCYPYKVDKYNVKGLQIDSLFFSFPFYSFCDNWVIKQSDKDSHILQWTLFKNLDKKIIDSFIWDLKNNNENIAVNNLQQIIKSEIDFYFSGCYRYFLTKNGNKVKSFYRIAIYIPKNKELHIFNEIIDV